MGSVVLLVICAAAVIAVAYGAHVYEQRRKAAARTLAAARGYTVDTDDKDPPPLGFDLFEHGHSKRVSYHTWRVGLADSAFQYRYTTGSGKDKRTYKRSCALVEVPFTAPHLTIGPEGFWSSIGKMVGIRDIEIESHTFNARYRVACADERFAVTLLDPAMIAWMNSPAAGVGVRFEFGGRWMLCWGEQLEFEQLLGLLEWAQGARQQLPTVLASLYPPR